MSRDSLAVVILAAGQGTRMKSAHAKVLHGLGGRPLVGHVLRSVGQLGPGRTVVVVGHQADAVREACTPYGATFATQTEQKGTGHAVIEARDQALADFEGDVMVLYGDCPLLLPETLERLAARHAESDAAVTLLTTNLDDPFGYGRIIRGDDGALCRIVEEKDASDEERAIQEVNPGIYCVDGAFLRTALDRLTPNNAQGELYLTDVIGFAVDDGRAVQTEPVDESEVQGINSRADLARLDALLRERIVRGHLDAGVTFVDPATAYIEDTVQIGPDTIVGPMVRLRGNTKIGRDCELEGNCFLTDTEVGDGVHLKPSCVLVEAKVGDKSTLGPFAHLRPGAELHTDVHIGNFVEVKKSTLGDGTKANHLSYIGDSKIGREVNVGAGTITCNYDGFSKHQTTIGDRVQVGSDTQLVAPITIGDDAYIATGTTVRHDVAPGALAFNPKPDKQREGWVEDFRRRKAKG